MNEPTYQLQLKAADERRILERSFQELRRRVFSPRNKEFVLLCGALALVCAAGYALVKFGTQSRQYVGR